MGLGGIFARDLAIDLGTANTVVFVRGKGIVIREPSVVAIKNSSKREVLAIGDEAYNMIGRTPGNIIAVRPLKDGVIADFDITEVMLKYFIEKAFTRSLPFGFNPRVVICVPGGVTEVEKRAVEEVARLAGAREAYLLDEPMAAALGAGIHVEEPNGSMIVDIGGGTTEVGIVSLGGLVTCRSLRIGGNHLDEAIISYIRKAYNLIIGERTAESIKIAIGAASSEDCSGSVEIRGRDIMTGLPQSVSVCSEEIYFAMHEQIMMIISAIKQTLEHTPPELAGDIMQSGIKLSGGGALLRGIDKLIYSETGMTTIIAENPMDCVALGAGIAVEEIKSFKNALNPPKAEPV